MTDLTDHDRTAYEWAQMAADNNADPSDAPWRIVARHYLATVEAPATTLAEDLADITEHWEEWATDMITGALNAATTRAEKMERAIAEARAEVERLTAENDKLRRTDDYKEFRDKFLTVQKGAESNAETPNPADVPPGEAWKANIWYGDERHLGTAIKNHGGDWTVCCRDGTRSTYRMNEYLDLIAPLVPEVDMTHILTESAHDIATTFAETLGLPVAPRVITDPDELDQLAATSIIRDGRGWPGGITEQGGIMVNGFCLSYEDVLSLGPATVLWEPGA